tara:strand:+ start:133 stop:240 length:108 start_codon:yes stop_codon:yes gene_type:complete
VGLIGASGVVAAAMHEYMLQLSLRHYGGLTQGKPN